MHQLSGNEYLKQERLKLLEKRLALQRELPHLYAHKKYPWQRTFYDSLNSMNLLTAANQIGKSSININKCIDWATDKAKWKKLWPLKIKHEDDTPGQFWYLYPDAKVATVEYHEKWVKEFLPKGAMRDDPVYGWHPKFNATKQIEEIRFNSGVTIYFKTYAQNASSLQSGTVYAIFCFTEGHLIHTPEGLRRIEEIQTGDYVMTRNGPKRVLHDMARDAEVFTFHFSNGEKLEGTSEHPIFTDRGWVTLGQLTPNDRCYSVPLWKLQKKLFYFKALFTFVTQIMKTVGNAIIFAMKKQGFFMLIYGKLKTKYQYQKIMSFIMWILTHLTILLKTYSFSLDRSIQQFIKRKSGEKLKPIRLLAVSVGRCSYHALQNWESLDTAITGVENRLTGNVKKVYNITVEDTHEYFSNGILTHNCDEELPFHLYDEIKARISAVDGYFHLVFTATLNQDEWRRAMEPEEGETVMFPDALKLQISLYDCRFYEDGSRSDWTDERIQSKIDGCSSETEVNRRIHGKFVSELNRKYQFEHSLNTITKEQSKIKKDWAIYTGVDIGSGGKEGHPAAMVFVAVSPDYTLGEVFMGMRMDYDIFPKNTTAGDILEEYLKMRDGYEGRIQEQRYDYAARDFKTLADRISEPFLGANKRHDEGEDILNTLFRYMALTIHKDAYDLLKLCTELKSLKKDGPKKKDDYADALRYACVGIPWDLDKIKVKKFEKPKPELTDLDYRRGLDIDERSKVDDDIVNEISYWNDHYDS